MIRIFGTASVLALITFALAPSSGVAATQIGTTVTPTNTCPAGFTFLQSEYSAPSDGVITRWDFQAPSSNVPHLKFKVGRHVTGTTYAGVGESGVVIPVAATLNQNPVRIPVKAGDLIGLYSVGVGNVTCDDRPNPGFLEFGTDSDLTPGAQTSFDTFSGFQLDVAAALEPDADNDGFGDETQDQCPTNASTQGPCSPPAATSPTGPTGQRAVALKKCKKKHSKKARRKCRKKAKNLPV